MQAAVNKLRLKKKDAAIARLYVWRSGAEVDCGSEDVHECVSDGDLVVVSLGEPFTGRIRASIPSAGPFADPEMAAASDISIAASTKGVDAAAAQWEVRTPDLAIVEWRNAAVMNRALGRASTLLEHPRHHGVLVSHREQMRLPSSAYLGHNLYAETLLELERLALHAEGGIEFLKASDETTDGALRRTGDCPPAAADLALSSAERAFLSAWREHGCPSVVISYVFGELSTLSHELCHARYALLPKYRQVVDTAWEGEEGTLNKWMGDLGYHGSRHADEFGAYLLTEPHIFWRGRVPRGAAQSLRAQLELAVGDDHDESCGPFGKRPVGRQACHRRGHCGHIVGCRAEETIQ
jgi:hypothetical protein